MVALIAWWFTLMDMAKTKFFTPFSSPTSRFLNLFHSFFALDPPCLELHGKHQFEKRFHFWMGMVALVARWFTLLDMAKTAFLAPFSLPTSQFLDYFHSFSALDPLCLELHAKHQFGEIPLLDGHDCPGCPVVFLAGCGKNNIFCKFLDSFHFFFCIRSPLPRATC